MSRIIIFLYASFIGFEFPPSWIVFRHHKNTRGMLHCPVLKSIIAALFLTLVSLPSPAAQKDFPLTDMDSVIKSSSNVNPDKYPDADSVLIDEYEYTEYNTDGTYECLSEDYVKILTEKGRREMSSKSLYYHTIYETLEVKSIELIKRNGSVVPINMKEQSQEMVYAGQMGSNIYDPNMKNIKINIPGLEIGDIVRTAIRENAIKTRMPNTWSSYCTMEDSSPIIKYTIEISAPDTLPLVHKVIRDEIKETVKYEESSGGGRTVSKWTVANVPQVFPEPNMPELYSVVQRLLASTINDWQHVSKWYWNLCAPHLDAVNTEMKTKVAELCDGKDDDLKKIEAIFYYVSQNIRYMGITTEKEAPGYEPHDVSVTFENKYGVCRDKAALLVAMLRLAGFKSYPVLIMAGPKKDNEVPNPYFNHAIVCVDRSATGQPAYILMDPTDENTRELLPAYLSDKSYLAARPEGDMLRTSPIIPADENMLKIHTKASVNETGVMLADTEIKFEGINDGMFRGHFARLKPEERKKSFESLVKKVLPSAMLIEWKLFPENINDTSVPLNAKIKYFSDDVLTEGTGAMIIEMPWFGTKTGVVNFVLGETGLDKRKYALETDIACGTEEKIEVNLENAVGKLSELPVYGNTDNELFQWTRNLKLDGNILSGDGSVKLKTVRFSPAQYLELRNFLKNNEYESRKKPVFRTQDSYQAETGKKSDSEQDMLIIKDLKEYQLTDSGTLKITVETAKKILSYGGKKKNSEIKISYNPAWDDVKIEYAKVTSPLGGVKELSPEEINMMDQAWVASAPRYPAGKILVASLPGVDENSLIEYKIVYEHKNRPFYSFIEYFQGFNPIKEKKVGLKLPENKICRISELNIANKVDRELAGNSRAWRLNDMAGLKNEKSLPPLYTFVPGIVFSDGDWRGYCAKLKECLTKSAGNQKETIKKALEIAGAEKNRDRKIRKIRDFVAINIRAAGPEINDLPFECISPGDRTLADAYGNSADRAVLIHSMLEAVGIESEFVVASDLPCLDTIVQTIKDNPVGGIFNRVTVKISGEDIYLNDTNQYAEIGTSAGNGLAGLFLNSGEISEIKSAVDRADRTENVIEIRIDKKGNARIVSEQKFYGNDFTAFNQQFSEITPEEKRRYFQEACAQISQSARPSEDLYIDNKSYPGIERISVDVERFAVIDRNYMYFYINNPLQLLAGNETGKRENPYFIGKKSDLSTIFKIVLPENDAAIAPQEQSYFLNVLYKDKQYSPGTFSISAKPADSGKVWNMSFEEHVKPCIVPSSQMKELFFINDRLLNPETETFLIFLRN